MKKNEKWTGYDVQGERGGGELTERPYRRRIAAAAARRFMNVLSRCLASHPTQAGQGGQGSSLQTVQQHVILSAAAHHSLPCHAYHLPHAAMPV